MKYGIVSINKLHIFHSSTALCGYLNCASTIASNYKIPQKGASNCLRKNEISFIFMKHNDSYFFKFFTSFVCCQKRSEIPANKQANSIERNTKSIQDELILNLLRNICMKRLPWFISCIYFCMYIFIYFCFYLLKRQHLP